MVGIVPVWISHGVSIPFAIATPNISGAICNAQQTLWSKIAYFTLSAWSATLFHISSSTLSNCYDQKLVDDLRRIPRRLFGSSVPKPIIEADCIVSSSTFFQNWA